MEEIVRLIPLLLIAVIFEPTIVVFIVLPPMIFGFGFALIEWGSASFAVSKFADSFQIALYTSFTALVSEFAPLFLTSVSLVALRRYLHPTSWQLAFVAVIFEGIYSTLHLRFFDGHTSDIALMVTFAAGIGAYIIDKHQKEKGTIPLPPESLHITPGTDSDFGSVVIRSDRLDLKSLKDGYGGVIFESFTPEVSRYMSTRAPLIPAESDEFVRQTLKRMEKGYELVLAIHGARSGEFLGLCGIHARNDADRPELGIWLKESAQKKGYGEETIDALINWASRHLECDYLGYVVSEHNIPSRKIAESSGGVPTGMRTVNGMEMIVYAIPLRQEDPALRYARLVLWSEKSADNEELLHSPYYRLDKTRDIMPQNKPDMLFDSFEIHGRYLKLRNKRIQQRPGSWIEAGLRIRDLIDHPSRPLVYCNLDTALALSLAHISQDVEDLLSIELISAISLDPSEPEIINPGDPVSDITKVNNIPDNYYVIILNINGRYKYIYHIRSNGEIVFEDLHTMGSNAPSAKIISQAKNKTKIISSEGKI